MSSTINTKHGVPRRLYVGMRVTAINDISLVGYSYGEVLDMINRLQRPLRIKFADISKGVKVHHLGLCATWSRTNRL